MKSLSHKLKSLIIHTTDLKASRGEEWGGSEVHFLSSFVTKLSGPPTNKEKKFIVVKNKETSILLLASRTIWENSSGPQRTCPKSGTCLKERQGSGTKAQSKGWSSQKPDNSLHQFQMSHGRRVWTREMGQEKKNLSIRRMDLQIKEYGPDVPFKV